MAIPAEGLIQAWQAADVHVQLHLDHVENLKGDHGNVSVTGCVIKSFRPSSLLKIGDRVTFALPVISEASHDTICGGRHAKYESVLARPHLEALLIAHPTWHLAADWFNLLEEGASDDPTLQPLERIDPPPATSMSQGWLPRAWSKWFH